MDRSICELGTNIFAILLCYDTIQHRKNGGEPIKFYLEVT